MTSETNPPAPAPRRLPPVIWYTLTGILLASTVCACAYTSLVFFNPFTSLNPFPPPTRTPWAAPDFAQTEALSPKSAPTLPPLWTPTPAGAAPLLAATTAPSVATPLSTAAAPVQTVAAPTTPTLASATAAPATSVSTPTAGPSLTPAPPTPTAAGTGYPYPGPAATETPASYP